MTNSADFIGRGFRFPLQIDQAGSLALTDVGGELETSIRVVLMTAPGERLMRPKFGCEIWELMFEPINANTLGLMAQAVYRALGQWEPRIAVEDVVIDPVPGTVGAVAIRVDYLVKATNDRRNLVYPFYTIPREGEQ